MSLVKSEYLPELNSEFGNDFGNEFDDRTACGRRRRQLVPSEQKDDLYWQKRKKNNDAARRSREKRRANDMVMERRLQDMQKENAALKSRIYSLQVKYGEITPFTPLQNANLLNINTQLVHQQAHSQAMQAAALAAKQQRENLLLKMNQIAGGMSHTTQEPPVKMQKITPEVTLPDGRKMILDHSAKELERPPSPASSDSSNHIIVDDEVDVDDSTNFKISGSSGVSSDNESVGKKSGNQTAIQSNTMLSDYYKLYGQNPNLLQSQLAMNLLNKP